MFTLPGETQCVRMQGPYGKQDIQEWYTSGFFPLDLPMAHTKAAPASAYKTLRHMLQLWGVPIVEEASSNSLQGSKPDQQVHCMPILGLLLWTKRGWRGGGGKEGLHSF